MINENYWKRKIILFLTAETISLFGSSLVQYAIIWYITLSTSSGLMLTISTLCGFLPQIAISLFAGVWIDRYNRKNMIMLSDGIIAAATLVLAILFLLGVRSIWALFIILAIRSAGTGIQTPAVNALIPEIVPKERLMKINGINSTISSLIMFISPAISGAILSVTTIESTLFIDVVTAIIGISIMMLISIQNQIRVVGEEKSTIEDIKQGYEYLKRNIFVKKLIIFLIIISILISPAAFLTPLMVSRSYGKEVWRLTASEMTFSAGAFLGGVLIATWGGFKNRMNTTILACLAYGIMMIGLGIAPEFIVYLLANTLIGVTMPCFNAPITVLLQEKVDKSMHGRVFSIVQIGSSCALPLGMVLFGPLGDIFTIQNILICNGIIVVVCTIHIWKNKIFKL